MDNPYVRTPRCVLTAAMDYDNDSWMPQINTTQRLHTCFLPLTTHYTLLGLLYVKYDHDNY